MVELSEPHAEELVHRLQMILYRRAVLGECDAHFASDLVERLMTDGTATSLDAAQWAQIERILGRTADPVEADALPTMSA